MAGTKGKLWPTALSPKELNQVASVVLHDYVHSLIPFRRERPHRNFDIPRFQHRERLIEIVYDDAGGHRMVQ
jgi:hypothetical protein